MANDLFAPPDRPLSDDGRLAVWRRPAGEGQVAQLIVIATVPSDAESRRLLLAEYQQRDRLDPAWACQALEIDLSAERAALTLRDPGGELLRQLLGRRRDIDEFLRLAIGLAAALRGLHAIGTIHKALRPDGMLVDPSSGQAWFVGCGLEPSLQAASRASSPNAAHAMWSYLAPEQCRGAATVDARTDLYSLGVLFYQLLTGTLPFAVDTLPQLLHAQLARLPQAPAETLPQLPQVASRLVMSLLAKAPGDRYQSAAAVESDLRRCQAARQADGQVADFELCVADASSRLRPALALYGRNRELQMLRIAHERVAQRGGCELILLSGKPGVGKTRLVDAFRSELAGTHSRFASGKSDTRRRDVPYATFAQALQSLVRGILGRPEPDFSTWRDALKQAVHPNGQLLASLVTELAHVLGPQPVLVDLSPQDMQSRFRIVLRRMLQVFARPQAPLILFLDDLQWADPATLDLIENLLTDAGPDHLLLIGSCRDNDADRSEVLAPRIAALREAGARVEDIAVSSLPADALGQLIADQLGCGFDEIGELTQLVHRRTEGNPFFAGQYLRELAQGQRLDFDPIARRWTWNLARIESEGLGEDVIGLIGVRLDRLPAPTRRLLEQMACLGSPANASQLAAIAGVAPSELNDMLGPALTSGLIAFQDEQWTLVHDRVREAAYALLSPGERIKSHLRIGRQMLGTGQRSEGDFETVDQLNLGGAAMSSQLERDGCALLNLLAARRAVVTTAYASALRYLSHGDELIGSEPWKRCARLAMDLHLASAETEFLAGLNEKSERRLFDRVLPHVEAPADTAAAYRLLVLLDVVRCNYDRAIARAAEALQRFGLSIEAHPSAEALAQAMSGVQERLQDRDIDSILVLPLAESPSVEGAMAVLAEMLAPACFTDERLAVLHLCLMVDLTLDHGMTAAAVQGLAWFGVMLGHHQGRRAEALRFTRLARALVDRHRYIAVEAKSMFALEIASGWTQPVDSVVDLARATMRAGVECNDVAVACFAAHHLVHDMLARGDLLEVVQHEIENGLRFARRNGFRDVVDELVTQERYVAALSGVTSSPGDWSGVDFDANGFEVSLTRGRMPDMIFTYWVSRAQSLFIAGLLEGAKSALQQADDWTWSSPVHVRSHLHVVLWALVLAAHETVPPSPEGLRRIRMHRELLAQWSESGSPLFTGKLALVDGEIARLEERALDAARAYERAIEWGEGHGFVHDTALAHEFAARHFERQSLATAGRASWRAARSNWLAWGALGRVRQLDKIHSFLRVDSALPADRPVRFEPADHLDLGAIIDASQALSAEIRLDRLIEKLMTLAIENAGAQRGLLMLAHNAGWNVEAEASAASPGVAVVLRHRPLVDTDLPMSILNYAARAHTHVLLDDATEAQLIGDDAYRRVATPRSVLCLPFLRQGRTVAMLYLENNLAPRVFTPARVEMLALLASQAAISLEHASLVADFERENRERQAAELEQARARTALAESERRFALAVAGSNAGIWDIELPKSHMFVSERAQQLLGLEIGANVRPRAELQEALSFHPDDAPRHARLLRDYVAGRAAAYDGNWRVIDLDGRERWVHIRGVCQRDADGRAIRLAGSVTDIDAQKRAEEALRQSEKRHALAMEAAREGHWDWIIGRGDFYASPRLREIYGFSADRVFDSRESFVRSVPFHPDDRLRLQQARAASFESVDANFDLEARILRDGEIRWVHLSALVSRDAAGAPIRWTGSVSDITERKAGEMALRDSEQRYALAMSATRDGHWDWQVDTDQLYASARMLDIYGFPVETRFRGRDEFLRYFPLHAEDRPKFDDAFKAYFDGRLPRFDIELRAFRRNRPIWVRLNGLLSRDAAGKPVRWTGTVSDITDRKEGEVALRESEQRFALAVAGSNDGIWDLDFPSDLMFLSERAQRLYGLEPGATLRPRQQWSELQRFHPDDQASQLEAMQSYLDGRLPDYDGEWRVRHAGGSYHWVRVRGLCVRDAAGRPMRMAGSVSDIDARRRAQAALQQAQRLEAVGTLAGGIAHDFNNILGAILGFGESAMSRTRAGSRVRRDLAYIVTAGERGRALIERILAFSRTGVGARVPVQVEGVVQEALQLISSTASHLEVEAGLNAASAAILGDATQIHQVLMNLMTNAVQAMPEAGTLRVVHRVMSLGLPRVVTTGMLPAGEYVVVEIGDTGCGIAGEILARIFDPFFTTKDVGAGTGLGLSVAHGIVTEMAGAIDVNSEPGVGSVFTVYLPRAADVTSPAPEEPAELPRGAHEQVLLVDDEDALLQLMSDTLTELGYVPIGFSSGQEALAAFAAHPDRFDALITDERMPGLSGAALIRAVRAVRPSIPVLLVSGYLGPLIVERARSAGADMVLRKPLSTPELAHSLARALRDRTGGDEAAFGPWVTP